jgi:hypothetical protein
MSPPEVWGPAVWTLFHTLIEKLNPQAYPHIIGSMFNMIVRICNFLPCPECSRDASNFLAKINLKDYKTKTEFKNMLYLFHNYVNAKKRKSLYNYANMNKYSSLRLYNVVNNFIKYYNTKGNMNLLTESFQRTLVIKDFIKWIKENSRAFVIPKIDQKPTINKQSVVEEIKKEEIKEQEIKEPEIKEPEIKEQEIKKQEIKEQEIKEQEIKKPEIIENLDSQKPKKRKTKSNK